MGVRTGVKVGVGACVFVNVGERVGRRVELGPMVGGGVDVAIFLTVGVTGVKVRVGARVFVKEAVRFGVSVLRTVEDMPGKGVTVPGRFWLLRPVGVRGCVGIGVRERDKVSKVPGRVSTGRGVADRD